MPVRVLPPKPNLEHLKYQTKDLLKQHAARVLESAQTIREFHPRFERCADAEIFDARVRLNDAQLTVARSHGFDSWARLKRHVERPTLADRLDLPHHERIEDPIFRHAVDLLDAGDTVGLRRLLQLHPKLVKRQVLFEGKNYFRSPTLLEFVAENPIRHGKLPANILDVARVILEAGAEKAARDETLMLIATGSVARECRMKSALIALLCEYGADPDKAIRPAAILDEHDAVLALIDQGARVDVVVAAALGRVDEFEHLVKTATADDRWLALAVAAQFGHAEIVRALLDAGEDPSRYHPPGGHAHATPLHQAALAGHEEVVRLLVERGARLDLKDTMFGGTAADWAAHAGKTGVEQYLRSSRADGGS
jgi:Ankyrin repeats (3 copies)